MYKYITSGTWVFLRLGTVHTGGEVRLYTSFDRRYMYFSLVVPTPQLQISIDPTQLTLLVGKEPIKFQKRGYLFLSPTNHLRLNRHLKIVNLAEWR